MPPLSLYSFDWSVQQVVSSSSAFGVNSPLLRLQLFVRGAWRSVGLAGPVCADAACRRTQTRTPSPTARTRCDRLPLSWARSSWTSC